MRRHEDLLQQPTKWPYELALETFKAGTLVVYKKDKVVKTKLADGTFQRSKGRDLIIRRGQIALVIKGPYIHECGKLICLQVLHGKEVYEDRYLAPNALLKHIGPAIHKLR